MGNAYPSAPVFALAKVAADEAPALFDGSEGGCTGAHERIADKSADGAEAEHDVAGEAIGPPCGVIGRLKSGVA